MTAALVKELQNRKAPATSSNLVLRLIQVQESPFRQFLAFDAFMVMFTILMQSPVKALALIISMYLHEYGHGVWFGLFKVDYKVRLLFPLGAVAVPSTQDEMTKSDQLHMNKLCYLLMGGPAVNVALLFLANLMIPISDGIYREFWVGMRELNGMLAISNLIPIWKLDAGQMVNLFFNSLSEKWDRIVAICSTIIGVGLLSIIIRPYVQDLTHFAYGLYINFGVVFFIVIFIIGMMYKHAHDKAEYHGHALALSVKQIIWHNAIWFVLVIVTLRLL